MRLGFFLGFLIGAAVASVLGKVEHGEAPAVEEAAQKLESEIDAATESPKNALGQLKQHAREAMDAAKEAADEKEAEMRKAFEQSTKPQDQTPS
ncbi:MAG: hypothetical protein GEU75_04420 [Dehalococcoidia bacterium]|nr:hypothetical protein [Dehalococcoidia bacterium]